MTSGEIMEAPRPATIQDRLAHWCEELREAVGEQLVSIVLYGGLAKGEYTPDSSDVNVMIVLNQVDLGTLDKVAPIIQSGLRDFRLASMLLGERDLRRSSEVFPVKFLDMHRHHRVLWGKDLLSDLTISRDYVRLRCAQEITNLLLRLRQFYVQRAHRPELIESTLTKAISSFLAALNTLTELKTGQAESDKSSIIEAAEKIGLDAQPLRDVLALKRGELKPNTEELKRLYDLFMVTVQRAAELVDTV